MWPFTDQKKEQALPPMTLKHYTAYPEGVVQLNGWYVGRIYSASGEVLEENTALHNKAEYVQWVNHVKGAYLKGAE